MKHCALALLAPLVIASPASASDRSIPIGSFTRIRVQGPFAVMVAASRTPTVAITGDDAAADKVEVVLDGETLTVRNRIGRWEAQPHPAATATVVVRVGSDGLLGASVIGGGKIAAERMKGARVDVTVTGTGTIAVGDVQADEAVATVIGGGAVTLAGRSGQARLLINGSGTIEAGGLEVGDLTVRLDGPGTTSARARFTAHVSNTGLGQVTIAGNPKCFVKADAGGPVACGPAPTQPH